MFLEPFRPALPLILDAIRNKDWAVIQNLSRSRDPSIRGAAIEAADCLLESEFQGNSMGTPGHIEPEISTLRHG